MIGDINFPIPPILIILLVLYAILSLVKEVKDKEYKRTHPPKYSYIRTQNGRIRRKQ